MAALIAITLLLMHFLAKVTSAVLSNLVAILVVTLAFISLNLEARTVIDYVRDMLAAEQAVIATLKGELALLFLQCLLAYLPPMLP